MQTAHASPGAVRHRHNAMAIAKVEPLPDRPRASRPVRLPRCPSGWPAWGSGACSSCPSGAGAWSESSWRSPSRASCPRSAWPSRSRRWRPGRRPSSCGSACGWRASTARPRPRARAGAPPGRGSRPGAAPRPALEVLAKLTRRAAAALEDGTRLGPRQRAVLAALAGRRGRARCRWAPGRRCRSRRSSEAGGAWAGGASRRRSARGVPRSSTWAPGRAGRALNAAQSAALELDRRARSTEPSTRELLLHGVTGSGKTEVYLAAAEAALARGRGAIVLVPEIALTPQTVLRFASRFGDGVALLHSRLSAGERRDEWQRLRSGEAMDLRRPPVGGVRAGSRSRADRGRRGARSSYKQEGDPRYDAREVAVRRAQSAGAVARLRQRDAAPGELGRACPGSSCRSAPTGSPCPRWRCSTCGRPRARAGPCTRRPSRPSARSAMSRGQGDRDAQPPRLVAVSELPILRAGGGGAPSATSRSSSTRARAGFAAITAVTPRRCRNPVPTAARSRWPVTAPGPSAWRS